jgi:mono/diheme cytochrome c family protein
VNQLKYIFQAVLFLFAGIIIYLIIQNFAGTKMVADNSKAEIALDNPKVIPKPDENGKKLFIENCSACHGIRGDAGFSHSGYPSMWPDKNKLFDFIRNPSEARKKNPYVQELDKTFGVQMTGSPKLTDEEIQSILDYIDYGLKYY